MPDYPVYGGQGHLVVVSTASPSSPIGEYLCASGGTVTTGAVWPSANLGIFVPQVIEHHTTVYQMGIHVTVQSGNVDVGIYNEQGQAVVRAGATAVAAAGFQAFNIADTVLTPGLYYLGMACDNGTAAFRSHAMAHPQARVTGVVHMASAYSSGLVATATFAAPSIAYMPVLAASLVPTI